MFHQPLHSLCTTNLSTISLGSCEITISYAELHDENTVEFPHKHPEYEIIYVTEGTLFVIADDESATVNTGEFLFLNKCTKHSIIYEPIKPKQYMSVCFSLKSKPCADANTSDIKFQEEHLSSFFKCIGSHNYFVYKDINHSEDYIRKMSEEAERKDWGWFYQLHFLYGCFILSILKNFVRPISRPYPDSAENLPIAFTRYLHDNYQNPDLSVQDLADHFFISTRHVNRLFKEFFGSSPTKTLTIYRLNYAKNYILETDYTLDAIAEKVGFSSASILSRLFKETEGITISQYRKLVKEALDRNAIYKADQTD